MSFEHSVDTALSDRYNPGVGVPLVQSVSLAEWNNDDGTTLVASSGSNVGVATFDTSFTGFQWGATADQTKIARYLGTLPTNFRTGVDTNGQRSNIILRLKVRKTGASDTNTALRLVARAIFHSSKFSTTPPFAEVDGESAASVMATPISRDPVAYGAFGASGSTSKFKWIDFPFLDPTVGLSAAERALLRAGATFQIQVYPNAAVGSSMTLDVLGSESWFLGHPTMPKPEDRKTLRS